MLDITFSMNVKNYKNIENINQGDFFQCKYYSGIYMKLGKKLDCRENTDQSNCTKNTDQSNCIVADLQTGNIVCFDLDEKVVLINCELIVNQ